MRFMHICVKFLNLYSCLISANVKAIDALWLVGDNFMQEVYTSFQNLRDKAKDKKDIPYVFQQYNVTPYHVPKLSNLRFASTRIFNSFVSGLNEFDHLPKHVMVIPDKDLIESISLCDYGIAEILEDNLKWLLININRQIELRQIDLRNKRIGALGSTSEPRLIWVTMLCRPENSHNKDVFSLARKFNQILEEVIAGDKRSHILKVHVDTHVGNDDRIGNLTTNGEYHFWRAIDEEMHDFDDNKTELEPFGHVQTLPSRHQRNNDSRKDDGRNDIETTLNRSNDDHRSDKRQKQTY